MPIFSFPDEEEDEDEDEDEEALWGHYSSLQDCEINLGGGGGIENELKNFTFGFLIS